MPYGETKVYFDGSHYIAIPHTTRPTRRRPKPLEEKILVVDKVEEENGSETDSKCSKVEVNISQATTEETTNTTEKEVTTEESKEPTSSQPTTREMTRKELFEQLYEKSKEMRKAERKRFIINGMKDYFSNKEKADEYVTKNLERKLRNLICRRIRLWRKIHLQKFNYFCTFTYDSKKHTEESFRKSLKSCLSHFCSRKGWKYIGVWERSPEKKRLHFHGVFYIPEGTISENVPINDYNLRTQRRQITYQNPYFNSRFGRSDFEEINTESDLSEMMRYIMKYMEKTGERLVYSKGLPQFFISDIMDEDIAGPIGLEDKKLLLFDDFTCWDEGCYMGKVSPEVIAQMRKVN